MPRPAPRRPSTAYEIKRRVIAIHEFSKRQLPTFTQLCFTSKDDAQYKFTARVTPTPDDYKSQWIVMPNATFMPSPDLRDWHMSEARIFVLDAADLKLKLTCTHQDKQTKQECGAVNVAPHMAGPDDCKYTVKDWQDLRVVMCLDGFFYILCKRYICGKCGGESLAQAKQAAAVSINTRVIDSPADI